MSEILHRTVNWICFRAHMALRRLMIVNLRAEAGHLGPVCEKVARTATRLRWPAVARPIERGVGRSNWPTRAANRPNVVQKNSHSNQSLGMNDLSVHI